MADSGFRLRLATRDDVAAIAALFRRVRQARLPYLPDLHTPEEDRGFFGGPVIERSTIWVAETDRVVGFCAYSTGWVDHLYVEADHLGRGIGSALLGKAMEAEPRLELWAFQKNADAIGFYRSKGFRVVKETDGAANEEREPDVLMVWESE